MKRLRSPLILAMAVGFFTPGGLGRVTAEGSKMTVGVITGLTEPMIRQVVQRRDDNVGNILVVGTFGGDVDGFQARSTVRAGMSGFALDWTSLIDVSTSGGNFVGIFRQPAGGFYDIQVRPTYRGQAGPAVTVYAVGVGEVFITAGQSNTTNSGAPTGFAPDLRVSSFVDGSKHGLDPSYPLATWRWGIDPQPVIDRTTGGSPWPTMASNLAVALNVPIGLYSAGCGGTYVEEWLPGYVKPATLVTSQMVLFNRLTNAINYFKLRSGVRAVLWEQGESDYDGQTNPSVYQVELATVIEQSRAVTGVPIKWLVAQEASVSTTNLPLRTELEDAQANLTDGELTFLGPNTDTIPLAFRQLSPGDDLPEHFNAAGLELLGSYWAIYVFYTPGFLGPGFLPAQ